jgi:hypothetical protein
LKKTSTIAASFLALGFAIVSFIFLVIEPRMGFSELSDFFDPAKVLSAVGSPAWFVGKVIYLGFGVALQYLAFSSNDRYLRASGLIAAVGFVFIASLGRVLDQLPTFIGDDSQLQVAVLGFLPVRLAALRTTVLALGVFAWRSTRDHEPGETSSAVWRGFGYLVLAASATFLFVLIPVPLVFTVWATWFAIRQARTA